MLMTNDSSMAMSQLTTENENFSSLCLYHCQPYASLGIKIHALRTVTENIPWKFVVFPQIGTFFYHEIYPVTQSSLT